MIAKYKISITKLNTISKNSNVAESVQNCGESLPLLRGYELLLDPRRRHLPPLFDLRHFLRGKEVHAALRADRLGSVRVVWRFDFKWLNILRIL